MADHAIDMTGASDDDEVEVVAVNPTSIGRSRSHHPRQETIDLTDPTGASSRNTVTRNSISRDCAKATVRHTTTTIDLCNSSDDDIKEVSSRKPPARAVALFRSPEHSDVVIVESPRKVQKLTNASPKIPLPGQASATPKKRSHVCISVSTSVQLVDLTDLGNEAQKKAPSQKSAGILQLKSEQASPTINHPQSPRTIRTTCNTSASIPARVKLIDEKTNDVPRIQGIASISDGNDGTNNKVRVPNSSPRVKPTELSAASPICTSRTPQMPKEKKSVTSSVESAPSSVESAISPSHDDDYSEDCNTSDSESSREYDRNRKRARKTVTHVQVTLRPRVGGEAIVNNNSKNSLKTSSVSDKAITDNIDHVEDRSMATDNVTHSKNVRPTRASINRGKIKVTQQKKLCSKEPKIAASRRSNRQSVHGKDKNETKVKNDTRAKNDTKVKNDTRAKNDTTVSEQKQDHLPEQSSDSTSSDDCSTEGDSTTSSFLALNGDIDSHDGNPIILDWKSVSSRSIYRHYDKIDDMIEKTNRAVRRIAMVPAGESRFFAPRYSGQHNDLTQWATYRPPNPRQILSKHISIYLPCDAIV